MISIKPVIGIAPNSTYMETSSSYLDSYVYANNFIKAILENGGIPLVLEISRSGAKNPSLKLERIVANTWQPLDPEKSQIGKSTGFH